MLTHRTPWPIFQFDTKGLEDKVLQGDLALHMAAHYISKSCSMLHLLIESSKPHTPMNANLRSPSRLLDKYGT